MIVTIDGPAGAGKSSAARGTARRLNFFLVQSGLMYRTAAYLILVRRDLWGKDLTKEQIESLRKVSDDDANLVRELLYRYDDGGAHISVGNVDVTEELSAVCVSEPTSIISQNKLIRQAVMELQHDLAKHNNIVAEGRDCGTVVFPHAEFKFFLTADLGVRAQRILGDPDRKIEAETTDLEEALTARDKRDKERNLAPMIPHKDAIIIDNTDLTLAQTVDHIVDKVKAG
ncbi:(d)CMP kinase [bacterium]|nr:(d)CMP kinase [bacterium]